MSLSRQSQLAGLMALLVGCSSPVASLPAASSPTNTPAAGTQAASTPATPARTPATEAPSTSPTIGPAPAITGLTGHVVFARAGGKYGEETTFVMNIDGSAEHQIGGLSRSGFPWASADGARIIVGTETSGRLGALLYDLDGSNETAIPEPEELMFGSGPLTSDGAFVVAETFTAPGFAFQAMNVVQVATGDMRKLVDDRHYISGDISPDDSQVLLFLNNPDVSPPAPGAIWVIGMDGTGLRQVTPSGALAQCCMNYRWSPDGSKVLFAGPEGSLWTVNIDGSNLTEVFHEDGAWAITPTWSPDGSMIMFALDPSQDQFVHPPNALYVIRSDGSDKTLVIDDGEFRREPIWLL